MPTPEIHAMLSASSSYRWLNCPPSAKLAAEAPKTTSAYAEAGRLAHAIGELKARKYFLEGMGPRKFSNALKKLKEDPHYAPEMDSATDLYLDTLKEQALPFEHPPFVALESRVDYSDIAPGGFGTADAILIGGDTIIVADYKNGAGVSVEAEENSQMKLYAYGALRTFGVIFGGSIQKVRLVIIQPHSGGVKTWETTREALERWAHETVAPIAALAAEGKGEFCAGDWCDKGFCPARSSCRARAKHLLGTEKDKGRVPEGSLAASEIVAREVAADMGAELPPLLSDKEVGEILTRAMDLEKWIKDLQIYVFDAIMSGAEIPGWKTVEGRRSREWTGGTDAAFPKLVENGVDEALLWERKPITAPGLEKLLGKKLFAELAESLVTINPGKPTLVPASDKRPPYQQVQAETAFQAVDPNG